MPGTLPATSRCRLTPTRRPAAVSTAGPAKLAGPAAAATALYGRRGILGNEIFTGQ